MLRIILFIISLNLPWLVIMDAVAKTAMPVIADHIVINKSQRYLRLYRNGKSLARYPISLGYNPVAPKRERNDNRTPEGEYVITFHTHKTAYTAALGISYPNARDKARAKAMGVDPGDNIEIHGMPKDPVLQQRFRGKDWTAGCIALSNHDIKEVYRRTRNGTRVTIIH